MLPLIDEWKPSSPAKTPYAFGVLAFVGEDDVTAAGRDSNARLLADAGDGLLQVGLGLRAAAHLDEAEGERIGSGRHRVLRQNS